MSRHRQDHRPSEEITADRERQQKVAQLILAGATYEQAAVECGYADRSGAWKAVQKLLARVEADTAEALRTVEGARIDRLQTAHWAAALRGDVKATNVVIRLMERRARLFGLDAPIRVDATVSDATDKAIAELADQLGVPTAEAKAPVES